MSSYLKPNYKYRRHCSKLPINANKVWALVNLRTVINWCRCYDFKKQKGFYCLYKLASYNDANGVLQLAAQALKRGIHPNIKMHYCSQLIVWGAIKSPKQFGANSASVALWQAESEGKTKPNMHSTNKWLALFAMKAQDKNPTGRVSPVPLTGSDNLCTPRDNSVVNPDLH